MLIFMKQERADGLSADRFGRSAQRHPQDRLEGFGRNGPIPDQTAHQGVQDDLGFFGLLQGLVHSGHLSSVARMMVQHASCSAKPSEW